MIPSYQFASLAGENVAKGRVMKTAKKGFQTEEQRAIKSGKVSDNLKNIYNSIIGNLKLQISTIETADALASTIEGNVGADILSYFIATIGKLVNLSRQLTLLIDGLGDMIRRTGNQANPSVDIGKIFNLMDDVDNAYGTWGEGSGLLATFSDMIQAFFEDEDAQPPQIDGLLEIFENANVDNRDALLKLQRNEYGVDLKDVQIPIRRGRQVNPNRARDIATGEERRNFTKDEYKMLLELKRQGILQEDDFTSVYSGDDGTIFSGSNGSSSGTSFYAEYSDSDDDTGVPTASIIRGRNARESDSDDDTATRSSSSRGNTSSSSSSSGSNYNPFGEFRYVARRGRPTYYMEEEKSRGSSGSGLYSIPQQQKRVLNMASGYAIPLRYY